MHDVYANSDIQNPFSASSLYSIAICGSTLTNCVVWLRENHFNKVRQESYVDIYELKSQFKDQAHLVSFIQELYNNHFTIVSIMKE